MNELTERLVSSTLELSKKVSDRIGRKLKIMEVCGTHTMVIAKSGLRSLLSDHLDLLSGPGCPVCVTHQSDIDRVIDFAVSSGVTIGTFGDMVRVPGSRYSLEKAKAFGAKVKVFYSTIDCLDYAISNPKEEIVFLGIGFETTSPTVSHMLQTAKRLNLKNLSVLSLHKVLPPALKALLEDKDLSLDGLILPGHVCTITGRKAFDFVAKDYGLPSAISGFEPEDVLEGIAIILRQIIYGSPKVEIAYRRLVKEDGNLAAKGAIRSVFEETYALWRGFGEIGESGLKIRDEFSEYDAERKFSFPARNYVENDKGCICGEIVRGKRKPNECPLFSRVCSPHNPLGPCMVSSEGACSAYYHYGD